MKVGESITSVLFLILITGPSIFSQENRELQKEQVLKSALPVQDFKIIASGAGYLEIEFIPQYNSEFNFENAIIEDDKTGYPDVRFRSFPVFFPTDKDNMVEIVDSRFEAIANFDLLPVPSVKKGEDGIGIVTQFIKDNKAYSSNEFYPSETVKEYYAGIFRNKYLGYLNIYPVQYNPAAKQLRKYTYIRARINFTGSPVYLNKNLSAEERNFFRSSAINADVAMAWSTVEFNTSSDSHGISNSIFASGNFHRIEVKETGMYKLDKAALTNAGINLSGVNPKTIKIYGNGGFELPFNNTIPVPIDPVENRIQVIGEEDGSFDDGDYIIFYGRSPHKWEYNAIQKTYYHSVHKFSNSNYYFITYEGSNGLRIQAEDSPGIPGINPVPYFKEKLFENAAVNNLGSTGYLWVSHRISANESFSFNKELKGYAEGSNVNFRFRFGSGSSFNANYRLEDLNSNFLMNPSVPGILPTSYAHIILTDINVYYPLLPGRLSINFKASLPSSNGNSPNVAGYYDFYEVLYDRYFSADNNTLSFTSPDSANSEGTILEYRVSNFNTPDVKIFNVTSFNDVKLINPVSYNNGTAVFQEIQNGEGLPRQYTLVGGNNYKAPVSISGRMDNQNLKGDLISGASFIILTPKEFVPAANRLKALREQPGPGFLKTSVIEIEKIYNEFSGGLQDPTSVRNFLKYSFNNWNERPVHVMFYGDGSYDYKNVYGLYSNNIKNWLPPLQKNSEYSDNVSSYCSDDFVLDINHLYNNPGAGIVVDFSTGRACVNNLTEANNVIDKIIDYESTSSLGKWKNKIMYVADDGWTTENTQGQEGADHTNQVENLAQNHTPKYFEKDKIYIVTYPAVITPQGRRKPGVNADIIKGWNEGRLAINYTGHGSKDLWSHERVFDRQTSIQQLDNKHKYPFLTVASCDFAWWDDPFFISGGEQLLNEADKGAIGVMAAVRPTFGNQNDNFNRRLWNNYLFLKDTLNLPIRIGISIFNVKQALYGDNDLKYSLLCDPTIRIGVPQYFSKIDSINGIPGGEVAQLKALQKVKINGSILRPDSSFWNDFNGEITIKILDVDKIINFVDFGYPFNFSREGGVIFAGKTNVVNGLWNVEFIVPRDISYSEGKGKITAYFQNSSSDGTAYSDNFIMNGLDTTAIADTTGPDINIHIGSRSFRSGDMVNQNPKLIADFFDEHGINLTGTIGHKIEGIINNNQSNKIDFTPFYETISGYQSGTVEYQWQDLADGRYTLEIKAWDTYNNSSSAIIDFNVKNSSELAIENIFNYPNPMRDFTSFIFQHNLDNSVTAEIKIFTVGGRLIKELNKNNIADKFVSLDWDGRDSDGDEIANGTYIYKIIIKSDDGSFSKSNIGKLAKLK